ncbi:sugar transferase [Roseobacter sp. HKCCD9010]|uniref:sugar transferase n=1 Tax=unclassified Roseobacter TaxID=196798 RepID=UPI0014918C2A|nr:MULTISPECIES: sugar transferase [unclassified Roseobacter]MBF9048798.1 sugar transferase [Rhodobacterales bacterium HKCCD4356]NNV10797.1 sugar transferase [Roseobacter sp. HKCCD7357]NNV14982.1 sugar transferase [Roseobacter sp. HKCCD8768]NNV24441.1 sugar transferase [Roseobacter sp. HKCCD8192]NNV28698.1 sugar transferase [Roseobacter sp. HKCCD9061]
MSAPSPEDSPVRALRYRYHTRKAVFLSRYETLLVRRALSQGRPTNESIGGRRVFWAFKRFFDIIWSLFLLGPMLLIAAALLLLNPFFNPGPLFFVQIRMGRGCRAFHVLKFRTMVSRTTTKESARRGADDPIDCHRITPLGRCLRKTRIDELPQIINVLKGDMSLIGPRPDYFAHARTYVRQIPGYRERHMIRPGISGLAQVEHGYAEGVAATQRKAELDLQYIRDAGFALDWCIFVKTLRTVLIRDGK